MSEASFLLQNQRVLRYSFKSICPKLETTKLYFYCPFEFDNLDYQIFVILLFGKMPYPDDRRHFVEILTEKDHFCRFVLIAVLYYSSHFFEDSVRDYLQYLVKT